MYFEKAGRENTQEVLNLVKEEAIKREITHIVIASTSGETGVKAARALKGSGIIPVVVSHNSGFKEPGVKEFDEGCKKEIEELGGIVYTGTMVLRGIGSAIKGRTGYSEEQIIADALRILGQGIKVAVEIAAMTSDAGLIPQKEVIVVAGTGRGADTALTILPNSSNCFFDIKVLEILAKPKKF